ncbi:MAG: hypothetical protein FWD28_04390 [Treponema sp.]|nr:hypothetical protein [Treponema sp.]
MKTIYFYCVFIFFCSSIIFATVQRPDNIIYNGTEYYIDNYLMEEYFEKYPWKRPVGEWMSTGLWRGYVATYEIIDNELWLVDIKILDGLYEIDGAWDHKLVSVFNKYFIGGNKIKLNWFNGLIGLYKSSYSNENEYYKLIEIIKGDVVKEFELNNKQYFKFRGIRIKYDNIISEYYSIRFNNIEYRYRKTNFKMVKNIYNELNMKYSEPLDYIEIYNEFDNVGIPKELIDYLINHIDNIKNYNLKYMHNRIRNILIIRISVIFAVISILSILMIKLIKITKKKKLKIRLIRYRENESYIKKDNS